MVNNPTYWELDDKNHRLSVVEGDFINLLKECDGLKSQLEKNELRNKKETKNILINYLLVLDAFDRIFKNIEDKGKNIDRQTKIWIGNFKAIRKKFESILKDTGVSLIDAPEGKAIPGWHTIVETKKVDGLSNDTIIEVIEKGYLWKNEVLKKALVLTVKNN